MRTTLFLFCLIAATAAHAQVSPPAATFLTDAELRDAIRNAPEMGAGEPGMHWLRISPPSEYPILGIRRTAPGKSELHTDFTDVWYVLEGAATVVTGGTVESGVETAPGEVRGGGIKNGTTRQLGKGEFAIIPAGVAHWVSTVDGDQFVYVVVKLPVQQAQPSPQ